MTDRELLEKAAKAYFAQEVADEVCSFWWDEKEEAIVYIHAENQDHNGNDVELLWIPLAEDGDALRLAVKLRIGVKYHRNAPPEMGLPRECAVAVTDSDKWFAEVDRDEGKATRRAIVRAAATLCE